MLLDGKHIQRVYNHPDRVMLESVLSKLATFQQQHNAPETCLMAADAAFESFHLDIAPDGRSSSKIDVKRVG